MGEYLSFFAPGSLHGLRLHQRKRSGSERYCRLPPLQLPQSNLTSAKCRPVQAFASVGGVIAYMLDYQASERSRNLKSHVMQNATLSDVVRRYQHLTKTIMPQLAQSKQTEWPVRNDHCFQRIVLDAICEGVWYDHIARPAYKHLSDAQALRAVQLCEDIIAGRADLTDMNRQSLAWRGKLPTSPNRKLTP